MSKVLVARLAARDKHLRSLSASNFSSQEDLVSHLIGVSRPKGGRSFISCKDLPTTLIAPLFYDQSLVYLCQHNGIAKRPTLLRWMSERDLIFPIMESGYGYLPTPALVAISTIPHASYDAFAKFEQLSAAREGTQFKPNSEIFGTTQDFAHLSRQGRHLVGQALDFVCGLPADQATVALEILNDAIGTGDVTSVDRARSIIKATNRLQQAKWLGATPQFALDGPEAVSDESTELDLLATSLNIHYCETTSDAQVYLKAIEPYRGALGFLLEPGASMDKALEKIQEINADLKRVMNSTRMRALSAVTNIFSRKPAIGFETFANAIGAPPGTALAVQAATAAAAAISPSRARIRTAAMAAYLGSDSRTIQIWRIRDRLARH